MTTDSGRVTTNPDPAVTPPSDSIACEHTWHFDGDDPYVICSRCGQRRDALTNRVIKASPPPPSDSIEARIAALHQFVSVPHDEWSSSFWHSQLDDALEVIDALADRVREAERELSICAYCGVAFKWDGRGDSCPGCDRAEAAEAEVKALREALREIQQFTASGDLVGKIARAALTAAESSDG